MKATKFCEIFTLFLTGTTYDKSKVKISQNFAAFSEYMNFKENKMKKSNVWNMYFHIAVKNVVLKFIYSEKATKFCEIFTLLLSYVVPVKRKVKISQNLVAFSQYMNFQ